MPTLLSPAGPASFHTRTDTAVVVPKTEETDVSLTGKKKKKKRRREEGGENDSTTTGEKKKKKKKKRRLEDGTAASEQSEIPAADSAVGEIGEPRRRKKKKDKDRQSRVIEPQIDPSLDSPPTQGSATALLSAIVAAATGSQDSGAANQRTEPQYDPALVPSSNPPQGPIHLNPYVGLMYGNQSSAPQDPTPPPPAPPSTLFPTANLPFSELNFGSNEDVLRALQSLDMAKITSVLRNIGEVTGSTSGNPTPLPPTLPAVPAPIHGNPGQTYNAAVHHPQPFIAGVPVPLAANPDHAHLLATKWLNAAKLAELVKTEGLIYRKGKFSANEEEQLEAAIENYRATRAFDEDQLQALIYPQSEKNRDNAFWAELTASVPLRPIIAVYHHVRRTHHPLKKQGVWTRDEDDCLYKAVVEHGQQWEKISPYVGRMPADCRDRYRNHIVNRDIRVFGTWSKEEEDKLTQIVTDMTVNQGKNLDGDVFWGRVSELMGGTRGRQQCRIKWTDALVKDYKAGGKKTRWSPQDAYILVQKVGALDVNDDTEIDWKLLPDPVWNLWSPHHLQRRWLTMKRGIKGYEDLSHQDILEILRIKKAYEPPPLRPKVKKPRVVSAASVEEGATSGADIAGSSTGPGTLAAENNQEVSSSSDSE
ncbi:hypothetical protein DXG01_003110 [Tephrocybe rancida]|nr:hypothetical protein DXG01_003110 [Tephrocybe rancida]